MTPRCLIAGLLWVGLGCGSTTPDYGPKYGAFRTPNAASDHPKLLAGSARSLDLDNLGQCKLVATCGDMVAVDCGMAWDGPYYYVEASSGRILEYCGGSCMGGPAKDADDPYCRNCPAIGWTCEP